MKSQYEVKTPEDDSIIVVVATGEPNSADVLLAGGSMKARKWLIGKLDAARDQYGLPVDRKDKVSHAAINHILVNMEGILLTEDPANRIPAEKIPEREGITV